ncbi:hypothetical protein BZA05DRAFT_44744 [Tricharina praecox]|uniref:uncharacterized protein n=1 Tax=Tricharina praecox TaxID=43433 RepID=UPI002220E632|nr:uncharacterized protein BZA05DRAFT_44744 [Tricharina praecox]KAI5851828.1 hypothetical protein BZA05DRAFT_44744 [Tricharina praecox]
MYACTYVNGPSPRPYLHISTLDTLINPPNMPNSPLRYHHVLFSTDGSITPLIATSLLPNSLTILPPADPGSIVALQEYAVLPCPPPPPPPPSPSSLCTAASREAVREDEDDLELNPPWLEKEEKRDEEKEEEEEREKGVKGECVYFQRREGCKRGDACRFGHRADSGEEREQRLEVWRGRAQGSNIVSSWSHKRVDMRTLIRSQQTYGSFSTTERKVLVACPTPGRIVDPTDPRKLLKTHCTFFLRFGECDYWPKCKFSHDQPESDGPVHRVRRGGSYSSWGKLGERMVDRLGVAELRGKEIEKEEVGRKDEKEKQAMGLQRSSREPAETRKNEQLITLLD